MRKVVLFDLPVFPKGVISLSLLSVAGSLSASFNVKILDLNISTISDELIIDKDNILFGLKVSAQSFPYAISLTQKLKSLNPSVKVTWGGELPTLLPEVCLTHAHSVVIGLFENVAENFVIDLISGNLKKVYAGENEFNQNFTVPDFSLLPHISRYYSFMGYPMETSRGCTEKCIFCMVHTMQKKNYNLKAREHLVKMAERYRGKFVNVIDYNFGVDEAHVVEVARIIKESGALGWMAEMCIELLDNERILKALKESNCKMVYCGLESIDQFGLNSVHKMNTNHIENYERIIRKAQSYGLQVAGGVILGLEGTHENTFRELYKFYQRMGIIYAKLTFLTYNPGTKVYEYEKKKGIYLTENIECYDGNQLTFLPKGVDMVYVTKGTKWFIRRYYSIYGIVVRSFNTRLSFAARLEFILFNICYRDVYLKWLKYHILDKPENLQQLIYPILNKSYTVLFSEKVLQWIRRIRANN